MIHRLWIIAYDLVQNHGDLHWQHSKILYLCQMMHVDSNNAYWNYMGGHCNSQLVVPKMKLGRVFRTRSNASYLDDPWLTGGLFSDGSFVGSRLALINDSTDFSLWYPSPHLCSVTALVSAEVPFALNSGGVPVPWRKNRCPFKT